jgi:hypothetical protein
MKRILSHVLVCLTLCGALASAQPDSAIKVSWPSAAKPTLKLTFSQFDQKGMVNGQGIFVSNVSVQNLTDSGMPRSIFTVYIFDKNAVRIGTARLQLPEIPPFRTQNAQVQFSAAGTPANVTLLAGKAIPLRIISIPPGANLKVDGEDAGITPKLVDFTVGAHTLEFDKEGYARGSTPLDVGADELPGGSISFELGGMSDDTVELRDGTVVLGEVLSMSLTDVTLSINGKEQKYERNQIKKIILVERQVTKQPPPRTPDPSK